MQMLFDGGLYPVPVWACPFSPGSLLRPDVVSPVVRPTNLQVYYLCKNNPGPTQVNHTETLR